MTMLMNTTCNQKIHEYTAKYVEYPLTEAAATIFSVPQVYGAYIRGWHLFCTYTVFTAGHAVLHAYVMHYAPRHYMQVYTLSLNATSKSCSSYWLYSLCHHMHMFTGSLPILHSFGVMWTSTHVH